MTHTLSQNPDFVVVDGIPRQKAIYSPQQSQTQEAFGFQWNRRNAFDAGPVLAMRHEWMQERYRLPGVPLADMIRGKRFLDVGCGAGQGSLGLFGDLLKDCDFTGLDISNAIDMARQIFKEREIPGQFIQASLMAIPEELGTFDVIFAEGVLHHTDSTRDAIDYLGKRLNPGGLFMFYVYIKKAPIREFNDDYIRQKLLPLGNEEAWQAMLPLTKLGKALGALDLEIDIEESVDILGIPAGKINLQRLFYWYIFKAFYRPDWTLEQMNLTNFDWYRPKNCFRHTPEEIEAWVTANDLNILKMDAQEAGITVVAQKPKLS